MESNYAPGASGIFENLTVTDEARAQLLEMAKWTKFLAIVHFVLIGLMALGGVVAGLALGSIGTDQLGPIGAIGGTGIMLFYLLVAALVFYPAYAMFRYAKEVRVALRSNNEAQLSTALRSLKRFFKYVGILTLVGLGLYALLFILIGAGAAFR